MTHDRSLILDTCVRVVFPTALVFSLFLLFAGHDVPGGGFVGGLVAGAAFVLLFIAGGEPGAGLRIPVDGGVLLGVGLTTALAVVAGSALDGGAMLEHTSWKITLPVFDQVKITTTLVFDIGVYLVVVGLALVMLNTLGREDGA